MSVVSTLSSTADRLMSNTASLRRSMRIPLDYYQILGVPIEATMGQIQQAYADRNLQQPRHEYTSTVLDSRRKLLGDAYEVLAHPSDRAQYDAIQMEAKSHFLVGEQPLNSLVIPGDRLLGGLLIMAEVGEYEQLLSITWPLLGSDRVLRQAIGDTDLEETRNSLHLIMSLTLLELGREEWRQNKPSEGCLALETGLKLLQQQSIYPTVQTEIFKELSKFRPQYILSLLCEPGTSTDNRQQALSLLQELVSTCSSPRGYQTYGITQDGFIAYIDQIRRYLTTSEQQNLFEEPALQSGNTIFTYLLVYAMVARGFYYQMPELIHRAKLLLLKNLGRRQDVFIEQALCYLLLGQIQEAQSALERSHDRESLAYIRKNSTTSEDLLLGLCRYSELWFQSQVFPHFLDLAHHKASLQEYFDNRQVQAYLEDLPPTSGDLELFGEPSGALLPFAIVPTIVSLPTDGISTRETKKVPQTLPYAQRTAQPNPTLPPGAGENVVPFERPQKKKVSSFTLAEIENLPETATAESWVKPLPLEGDLAIAKGGALRHRPKEMLARRKRFNSRSLRRFLTACGGLLGILGLVLFTQNFLRKSPFSAVTTSTTPPPLAKSDQTMNDNLAATTLTENKLTIEKAQELLEKWLQAKSNSMSLQYDVDVLGEFLTDPALTRTKVRAMKAKDDGYHWEFQHLIKVHGISNSSEGGSIRATVVEVAKSYSLDNKLNSRQSYNRKLELSYALVKNNGQWLIKDMTVVQ
jgi:ARC6-like, IMS domain/DnaJ domain